MRWPRNDENNWYVYGALWVVFIGILWWGGII